jgi:hypothetical protein
MTEEEAKKEVQGLLAQAEALISRAEALMDKHRFTVEFHGRDYCPRDLTGDEIENGSFPVIPDWMGSGDGGVWMGSSDRC